MARVKSGTIAPSSGSTDAKSLPLCPLQIVQDKRQVTGRRESPVFFGHDMIDGMTGESNRFGDQTVLTVAGGALATPAGGVPPECGSCSWKVFSGEFQGRLGLGDANEVFEILILLPFKLLGFGQAAVPVLGEEVFDALLECGRRPQSQHFARRRQTRQGFQNISKPRKTSAGSCPFHGDRVRESAANGRSRVLTAWPVHPGW